MWYIHLHYGSVFEETQVPFDSYLAELAEVKINFIHGLVVYDIPSNIITISIFDAETCLYDLDVALNGNSDSTALLVTCRVMAGQSPT